MSDVNVNSFRFNLIQQTQSIGFALCLHCFYMVLHCVCTVPYFITSFIIMSYNITVQKCKFIYYLKDKNKNINIHIYEYKHIYTSILQTKCTFALSGGNSLNYNNLTQCKIYNRFALTVQNICTAINKLNK